MPLGITTRSVFLFLNLFLFYWRDGHEMHPLQAYSVALIMHQADIPTDIQASLPLTPTLSLHFWWYELLHLCKNFLLVLSFCLIQYSLNMVYGNPWYTLKQRHQSQGFSLSLVQNKTFYLWDMITVLLLYFANDVDIHHGILSTSCMITYLFSAQNNLSFECGIICTTLFHG
jgi:hypothetical protein